MAAICKGCGKKVACGCQLVNGLCSTCRKIKKGIIHVTTKTYNLFGMH